MATRPGRRGCSIIHVLGAILLILLAVTISYSSTAPSTAIQAIEKITSTRAAEPLTQKIPVPFGENAQLGFGFSPSSDYSPPINGTSSPHKRAVPLDWDHALLNGINTFALLGVTRTQIQWTNTLQLTTTGWSIGKTESDVKTTDLDGTPGPYNTLGIDRTKGQFIKVEQNKFYDTCHHKHNRPTYGYFTKIYNVPAKTLIANSNVSPVNKLSNEDLDFDEEDLPPWKERIPYITYWSQVAGIMWFNLAGDQAGALKYIIRYHILTDDTKRIMNLAIKRYPQSGAVISSELNPDTGYNFELPWPGVEIMKGELSFQALLGTPHAKGIAQLIQDNPDKLPGKNIERITMFTSRGFVDSVDYNMLFTLTD